MFRVCSVHRVSPAVVGLVVECTEGANVGLQIKIRYSPARKQMELRGILRSSRQPIMIGLPDDRFEQLRSLVEKAIDEPQRIRSEGRLGRTCH